MSVTRTFLSRILWIPHAKMLLVPIMFSFSLTGRLCSRGKRFDWSNVIFSAYFTLRGRDTHIDFLQSLCLVILLISETQIFWKKIQTFWKSHNWTFPLHEFFFFTFFFAWIFFLAFSLAGIFLWFFPHPPHHFSNGPSLVRAPGLYEWPCILAMCIFSIYSMYFFTLIQYKINVVVVCSFRARESPEKYAGKILSRLKSRLCFSPTLFPVPGASRFSK